MEENFVRFIHTLRTQLQTAVNQVRLSFLSFGTALRETLSDLLARSSELLARSAEETHRLAETLSQAINQNIIPHRFIIHMVLGSIAAALALLFFSGVIIRLSRNLRKRWDDFRGRLRNTGTILKSLTRKDFYRKMFRRADQRISTAFYQFLLEMWIQLKRIDWIADPWLIRRAVLRFLGRYGRKKLFSGRILDKLQTLLTKKVSQDPQFTFEENQSLIKSVEIPVQLEQALLKSDSCPCFPNREAETFFSDFLNTGNERKKTSLLITGGCGSGKTSLLLALQERFPDTVYYRLNRNEDIFSDPSFRELMKTKNSPETILIDDLECLTLNRVGGLDRFKHLMELVHSSTGPQKWILAANDIFSSFMLLLDCGYSFQHHYEMPETGPDTLATSITEILKTAGNYEYRIRTNSAIDNEIKKRLKRKIIDPKQKGETVRKLYFEHYIQAGGNNRHFHSRAFLQSIEAVGNGLVTVGVPEFPALRLQEQAITEKLFILRMLLLHKYLGKDDISSLLLQNSGRVSTWLNVLLNKELITSDNDGCFMLNPPFYSRIIRLLKTKNLLYWVKT